MAVEADRGPASGDRVRISYTGRQVSTDRAQGGGRFRGRHVQRAAEAAVLRAVLLDVSHSGIRARPGPMGGPGADLHGGDARHPAAGLRQWADVRDAALRGTTGTQAVAN